MPIVSVEEPVVDQLAEHLLNEQGVSFGRPRDADPDIARQLRPTQQVSYQPRALGFAERLEHDQLRDVSPIGAELPDLRAGRAQDQEGMVGAESRDVFQQVHEGRLGPVDVLEDHHERSVLGQELEEPAHGPERLPDISALIEPDRGGDSICDVRAILRVPDEIPHLGTRRLRRVRLRDAGRRPDHLGNRPEGDPLAVGQTPTPERACPLGFPNDELVHQPGLPQARITHDGRHAADTLGGRLVEGTVELGQLLVPPDQGRIQPSCQRRGPRRHAHEAERRNPLGLAFEFERVDGLDLDGITNQPSRLLAEKDLPGLRRLLQARGDVDRVPRHEGLAARRVTGNDLPGVDSGPHLKPSAPSAFELGVEGNERSPAFATPPARPGGRRPREPPGRRRRP